MAKLVYQDEDDSSDRLSQQALSFFLHIVFALGAWVAFMLAGYAVDRPISQSIILVLSLLVPLFVGNLIARVKPDEMSTHIWLAGLVWLLLISLWILDMPTGPNACFECGATEKLTRTLFSLPRPSGFIDNNGPFFGTWPAAALAGYSIGARLALSKARKS
jgi:hypothetical protein